MKTKLLQYSLTLFVFVSAIQANAQTIINSLTELKAQLGASNANIKMTPGTYYFNTTNCGTGKLFPSQEILLFTGSNSTFDFTGVRFEFASEIFSVYSGWAVQFWPTGNNNIYRNLTMEIIGNKTPNAGGESVHLDGNDNLIEGFHTTVRSCFPYGYGDIFGKGGGSVIGHKKRAGILVRGDRNHLLNCTVMMRSYGHGIFMQGAKDALIEGCHVEGETRTIREVLEEEGTGSPADNVNFMSVWGYDLRLLQHNYTFSLQEDGIRAYTNGVNYGTTESRPTTGTQVVNCTVIKMRSGVTIGWDYTAKRVENCTVLACETGYWFGSLATAIGCKGDASLGPLVSEDVGRSNSTIEVTLLDNYVPKLGNTPYFYFAGSGHKLTLHDGTSAFNPDVVLQVGGKRYAHRWLEGSGEEPLNMTASKLTFTNNTKYPISLESNASNNTIITCGLVTNKGTGNTITQSTSCSYNRPCANTATNLEAECYDNMSGVVIESLGSNNDRAVGSIQNGEWISFNAINITNMSSITAIAGTNKTGVSIEIREGSATGTLLGTLPIAVTTGFFDYQKTPAINLLQIGSGTKNIFFVFKGPSGFLLNLDKISFIKDACATVSYNPFLPISAEDFCFSSGIVVENRTPINQSIGNINNGDYVVYSNVNFGLIDKYNSIELLASSGTDGGSIEVRSGAVNGELLATVDVKNTGGWTTYKSFSAFADKDISGTHNIYLVFKGESGFLFNIDNFKFYL